MSEKTCQSCKWLLHTRRQAFGPEVVAIDAYECNYEPKQYPTSLNRPACSKWEEKPEINVRDCYA